MSIHIYTYYPKECAEENTIINNDNYFIWEITPNMIDEIGIAAMQQVDKVTEFDHRTGAITTPRGSTSMDRLSSSCKTVLNYLYAEPQYKFINVTQCGANALEILFQIMEKVPHIQRKLILRHKDRLYTCNEREYIINGKKTIRNLLYM